MATIMTVLRDFAKAILRSTGKLSPRIARFSLRLFAANDNLFLRLFRMAR
jgi:hypothetical protein